MKINSVSRNNGVWIIVARAFDLFRHKNKINVLLLQHPFYKCKIVASDPCLLQEE